MTLWALSRLTIANFRSSAGVDVAFLNGVASTALLVLALYLVATALLRLRGETGGGITVVARPAGQ
jgi:hypothetical protein